MAKMDSQLEKMEVLAVVFEEKLNKMDTMDLEANPEKSEPVAEQQDTPKEEATVETIGAPVDQYGHRHLAVGRRHQPKKRTQRDGGSRQKLVAAR
jgi:hypothetical protein